MVRRNHGAFLFLPLAVAACPFVDGDDGIRGASLVDAEDGIRGVLLVEEQQPPGEALLMDAVVSARKAKVGGGGPWPRLKVADRCSPATSTKAAMVGRWRRRRLVREGGGGGRDVKAGSGGGCYGDLGGGAVGDGVRSAVAG